MNLGVSTYADKVDGAFWFAFYCSAVVLVGIVLFTVYCLVRYNKKNNPKATDIEGHAGLETLWTVIPTIIFFYMFYLGYVGFKEIAYAPDDPNTEYISVTGRMWSWYFEYDNGDWKKGSNALYIPVGVPVYLTIKAEDVLHSVFIPAFRAKQDAVPGMTTYLWFQAMETTVGKDANGNDKKPYNLFCAEYCGDSHSLMITEVHVLPMEEYKKWKPTKPPASELGKGLVAAKGGCTACHTLDGKKLLAPSFKGLFGRKETVITGGQERQVVVDAEYIKKSILTPQADLVKGYTSVVMPARPDLTEEEIDAIISYIKSLK